MLEITDGPITTAEAPDTPTPKCCKAEPTKAMLAKANNVAQNLLIKSRAQRDNELEYMKEAAPELWELVTARLAELHKIVLPINKQDALTDSEKDHIREAHDNPPDESILTLPLNTIEGFEQTIETYSRGAASQVRDAVIETFVKDKLIRRSSAISWAYREGMRKQRKVVKLKAQITKLEKLIKDAGNGDYSSVEAWHKKYVKKYGTKKKAK